MLCADGFDSFDATLRAFFEKHEPITAASHWPRIATLKPLPPDQGWNYLPAILAKDGIRGVTKFNRTLPSGCQVKERK